MTAKQPLSVLGGSLLLYLTPALAHHAMDGQTPMSFAAGLMAGLAHPVIGLDHLMFLIATGLLVAFRRQRARLVLSGIFVTGTVLGTLLHLMSLDMPWAEIMIALSVIGGGALLLSRRRLDPFILGFFLTAASLFHGYAYGESIVGAEATPLGAYLLGFSIVQYAVIMGIALAFARLHSVAVTGAATTERAIGAGVMLGGLFFLASGAM